MIKKHKIKCGYSVNKSNWCITPVKWKPFHSVSGVFVHFYHLIDSFALCNMMKHLSIRSQIILNDDTVRSSGVTGLWRWKGFHSTWCSVSVLNVSVLWRKQLSFTYLNLNSAPHLSLQHKSLSVSHPPASLGGRNTWHVYRISINPINFCADAPNQ